MLTFFWRMRGLLFGSLRWRSILFVLNVDYVWSFHWSKLSVGSCWRLSNKRRFFHWSLKSGCMRCWFFGLDYVWKQKEVLKVGLSRTPQKGREAWNEPEDGVAICATFGGLAAFCGLRTPFTNPVNVSKAWTSHSISGYRDWDKSSTVKGTASPVSSTSLTWV